MSIGDVEQLELDIPVATKRESILLQAQKIISHDRNVQYGEPEQNFATIARLWNEYADVLLEPHDVAVMLLLVKVARIRQSPDKLDHWVDIAGYAGCGGEIAAQP